MITTTHHVGSCIRRFIPLFIIVLFFLAACDPDGKKTGDTTTNEPDYKPACPPVNISQLWKLKLPIDKYNSLKTQATNGGALVFQFAYDKAASPRLTLVAYAAKPGRDFLPIYLEYLEPLEVSGFALPDKFSLGDQKVLFTGPSGLNQLIAGVPAGAVVESLTFTPDKIDTPYGTASTVTNIRYKVCVRYKVGSDYFEYCGANEVELQPSPPANHGN